MKIAQVIPYARKNQNMNAQTSDQSHCYVN